MSWLLKIVEGPMAGAEVALVTGTRVKIGSTDDCDIVVADASIPTFSLDVSDRDVTLVTALGDARVLRPFELESQGTTTFALGPSEGAWQPLVRRAPDPEPEVADTPPPEAVEEKETSSDEAKTSQEEKRPRRKGCGCGCALVVFLLLLILAILAWVFRTPIKTRFPKVAETVKVCVSTMRGWFPSSSKEDRAMSSTGPTLQDIADQYGLELLQKGGNPLLRGNVRLRTERLAIRALALAEDARTAFEVTDDESLKNSSEHTLFTVTEGALKVISASNRVIVLSGYAPSAADLERAIRALNADVPGIAKVETTGVQMGGTPPAAVAKTAFATPGVKAKKTSPPPAASRRDYPIAGIITRPYPLVVMRNGLRLAEGAEVGTAVIERIEEDRLILREGKTTFEWKP